MTALRLLLSLLVSLLVVVPAGATTIEVGGRDRSFEMYVPARAPRPLPVVLVLHGGGATSTQMRRYSDFDRVAARENYIAVYPQAVDGHWNDGRSEIANMDRRAARVDDVAFLMAIVDMLVEKGLADPTRVFATGISNGGMMVLHLACTQSDRLAGAAVVAANQPVDVTCSPSVSVPMMFFHGTDDKFVPYKGGEILQWANIDRGRVMSADETVAQWLDINGCSGQPDTTAVATRDSRTKVDAVTYEPCNSAPVVRYITQGGGHAWPGAKQSKAGNVLLGPAATGVNANDEIIGFFNRQPPRR